MIFTINISHCVQDYQEIGAVDKSRMVSRVFFTISCEGKTSPALYVELSQPYGTDYEKNEVEVGPPTSSDGPLKGPWNHADFSEKVVTYYRNLIGLGAKGISIGPGVSGIRMSNNTFVMPAKFTMQVDGFAPPTW